MYWAHLQLLFYVCVRREISVSGDKVTLNNLAVEIHIFVFKIYGLSLKRDPIKVIFVENGSSIFLYQLTFQIHISLKLKKKRAFSHFSIISI